MDLRERVVRAVRAGRSKGETSRLFEIDVSTVKRYLARDGKGDLAPKTSPGRPRRISQEDHFDLERQVDASSDATLEEHCETWEKSHGLRISVSTMHRAIKRAKYTLKSKR